MKLYKFFLLTLCTALVSCQKYVDIKKSSSQSFIESAKDGQLLLDNYEMFNMNYPVDGQISSDDYLLTDARYANDALDNDDRSLYTWNAAAIRSSAYQWVTPYNVIYNANLLLESMEEIQGKEDQAALNNIKGSALFFRAYALWNAAQLYCKPYSAAAAQDAGLPLRLKSDINESAGRGTVKATYDQIVADLKEASTLISTTSTLASRPNKCAVFAMLARVYLSMSSYPEALSSATAALELKNDLIDFNTLNTETLSPFTRFNKEVIFHSVVFSNNRVLEPGYGYEDQALVNPEIINAFTTNDLRKDILFKENTDVAEPHGSYRFTGNYEPAVGSSRLFNGLAVDELYFIRSECYARAGNVAAAMADLNTLLTTRWLSGTYVSKTAADAASALSLILLERRKGLVMRGLRWSDLRRLNMETGFARTLSRTINGTTYTLPPNDSRYTLKIPQEVINNSGLTQN
ncbi:RagB/SusD family nutrient uptake outer membrane protein [Pedobacter sp. AW31-3R]|uniref:RagB/SusD family nutrient uptake outer membrane protein n=1 Tax=Pedobacter sp. AW31-3R TaxID=3445781 RepID=UPI003F9F60CA